jgi:hypothetical protein
MRNYHLLIIDLIMTIKNARPSAKDLPDYVKEGVKRGRQQARKGLTKSTEEVLQKYKAKKY